ncbi:MAG: hypothetical protein MZV64_31955 [Ignavibacteriales bacterium]|nr:hypothetical protein [Ignavibacteriales bacterium]
MAAASGQNLDWFFDQWIFQPNHPVYQNGYYFVQHGSDWEVGFRGKANSNEYGILQNADRDKNFIYNRT